MERVWNEFVWGRGGIDDDRDFPSTSCVLFDDGTNDGLSMVLWPQM
jgi:hypothetical protein